MALLPPASKGGNNCGSPVRRSRRQLESRLTLPTGSRSCDDHFVSNTCRIQIVRQTGVTSIFNVITPANCLRDAGHTVDVVCVEPLTEPVAGLAAGITVTGLGAGKASGLRKLKCRLGGAWRLRRYLQCRTFEVLYVLDS